MRLHVSSDRSNLGGIVRPRGWRQVPTLRARGVEELPASRRLSLLIPALLADAINDPGS